MNCYERLGVTPIINASGSVTRLGGAPMPPAVLAAFQEAAGSTVPLELLQAAAAKKIAEACETESGLVTAGSAAALTLGAAAILAGTDAGRMERLPHCDGFPCEFLVAREHRNGYDHAVRAAGARFVEVGMNEIVSGAGVRRTEAWEYEAAITPQTAGILYVKTPDSRPALEDVVAVARRHNLPVLVDAAGELPPRSNLRDIPATGADVVCFSGGKAVRGPQSTGILCGRRELVMSAAVQMLDMDDHPELWEPPQDLIDRSRLTGMPRHGIGRTLKVSKEEIAALLAALDLFCSGAYDSDRETFHGWLKAVADRLEGTGAVCSIDLPENGQTPPILTILLSGAANPAAAAYDVCRRLRAGTPPVYVSHGRLDQGELVVYPLCLTEAVIPQLADRLYEECTRLG